MKNQLLLILTTILSLTCHSQITFEKGYYIDNQNNKIDCLIKNMDWKNNPTEIEFKLSENAEAQTINLKLINEFGIDNNSKFVKSKVNIDRSSDNPNKLSDKRNPIFKTEEVLLKVLIEGKSTLYQYVDINLIRYFYKKDNSKIEQLVYKTFKNEENNIGENNMYKQQLRNNLKCPNFNINKIENLEYKKEKLIKFFAEYNQCNNQEYTIFEKKQKRDFFNLTIRPRIKNSSLIAKNYLYNTSETDFGSKIGFGFGVEAEFILPFNNDKWSIAIEPTYQNFKSQKEANNTNNSEEVLTSTIDYSSIEIPLSLRYYFFLNSNSKIFMNASYIFDYNSKSSIEFTSNDGSTIGPLSVASKPNLGLGIGYKQNNKYSLELRVQNKRTITLSEFSFWSAKYQTISLIFGYSIF